MEPTERVVHAEAPGVEVVRYDKSGTWWIEHAAGSLIPAERVKIAEAVEKAIECGGALGGRCFFGRWGGRTFDRLIRKRITDERLHAIYHHGSIARSTSE